MLDQRLYAIAGGFIPLFTELAKEKTLEPRVHAFDLSLDSEREMVHVYIGSNEANMNLYVAITPYEFRVSIDEKYCNEEIFSFKLSMATTQDMLNMIPQMVYQVAERERRTRFVNA